MPMSRTNKILTGIVVAALIVTVGVLAYAYIPRGGTGNQTNHNGNTVSSNATITFVHGNQTQTWTMKKLLSLDQYQGAGGYRTKNDPPSVKAVGNYTGIKLSTIARLFNVSVYGVKATDGQNETTTYDRELTKGNVSVYSAQNLTTPLTWDDVELVLIYQYNGQPLSGSDGHFKIGFLNSKFQSPPITNGTYWWRDVQSI